MIHRLGRWYFYDNKKKGHPDESQECPFFTFMLFLNKAILSSMLRLFLRQRFLFLRILHRI